MAPRQFLARHADKTSEWLLARLRDRASEGRSQILLDLVELIRYERDPTTTHHLGPDDVERMDSAVREAIDDPAVDVRLAAIENIATTGRATDLPLLDRIAERDPFYYDDGRGVPYGIHYLLRDAARLSADRLRRRLARQPEGK